MFRVGNKVQTPHGFGVITGYDKTYDIYLVDLGDEFKSQQYKEYHLKRYISADTMLLDMGYSYNGHHGTRTYEKGSSSIRIYDDGSFRWLLNEEESPTIFDVIKQYQKELKENL